MEHPVNCEPILEWYHVDDLTNPIRCLTTLASGDEVIAACDQAEGGVRELRLDTGVIEATGTYYVKLRNSTPALGLGTDYRIVVYATTGPDFDAQISGLFKIKDDPDDRLIPTIATVDINDGTDTDHTRWCCGFTKLVVGEGLLLRNEIVMTQSSILSLPRV